MDKQCQVCGFKNPNTEHYKKHILERRDITKTSSLDINSLKPRGRNLSLRRQSPLLDAGTRRWADLSSINL